MKELAGLYPERAFELFEEMCAVPHGSYNTGKMTKWLMDYAAEKGICARSDDAGNVIMSVPGSAGKENSAPVILQGHIDMVCEQDAECGIDMQEQGVQPYVDGGFVRARGTTLGADNAIAVAYALAVMESDTIPHPPIEAVFTVDEEVGMLGAFALDMSEIKGRTLINIDSGEEGVLTVGCAGGMTIKSVFSVKRTKVTATAVTLTVSGCAGGHSGTEIGRGGANADKVLARLLSAVSEDADIIRLNGGNKDNAIPREAAAVVAAETVKPVVRMAEEFESAVRAEFSATDPDIRVTVKVGETGEYFVMDKKSSRNIVKFVKNSPDGVQKFIEGTDGAVQTSLNLGVLTTAGDKVEITHLLRSCVGKEKTSLSQKLQALCRELGGETKIMGEYPEWEYSPDSALRTVMTEEYVKMYGKEPKVEVIHGGLECGVFSKKLPGLDAVACGPDILGAHTPQERLDIASAGRVWDMLLNVLSRL